jgi:4-amino-4-deoxy-L-arabinose transferase-like glycosyltransferase
MVFGLATVALTADMGRRRAGESVGWAAGVLLAVNPLHVLHCHYGTVDVAAAFLTLLALDRIDVFWANPTRRNGLGAAVAVGLGAATKYYPGILWLLVVAEPFWRRRPRAAAWAAVLTVAALGAYAVGSPETLVSIREFARRFGHLFPKIVGAPGTAIPLVSTVRGLSEGLGPLVLGGALVGAVRVLRGGPPGKVIVAGAGLLLGFIGFWRGQSPHYALALYPVAALLAVQGFQWTGRCHRWCPAVLWGMSILLCLGGDARDWAMLRARDVGDWDSLSLRRDEVQVEQGDTPTLNGPRVKDVIVAQAELLAGPGVAVDGDTLSLSEVKTSEFVNAGNVVGVRVGIKDGVNAWNFFSERLLAEVS